MNDKLKSAALVAFRLALRPLVRILLRNGITWKQAAEVCKQTYVEVARADYGVHGRPTNASRVAILTGISRHEVRRVLDIMAEGEPAALQRMNKATRLLGGWHIDPAFCDAAGAPAALPLDGAEPDFTALCARFAPDIPPIAMLKELQRVGAVMGTTHGSFVPAMRYYMPDSQDPDAVFRSGSVLEDMGNTINFNLDRDPDSVAPTRFEGRASSANVRASAAKQFRAYIEVELQELLERVDEWLARHETVSSDESAAASSDQSSDQSTDQSAEQNSTRRAERTVRLGVGVYQIQDDANGRQEK